MPPVAGCGVVVVLSLEVCRHGDVFVDAREVRGSCTLTVVSPCVKVLGDMAAPAASDAPMRCCIASLLHVRLQRIQRVGCIHLQDATLQVHLAFDSHTKIRLP